MYDQRKRTNFTGRVADLDHVNSSGEHVIDLVMHGEVDFAWPEVAAALVRGVSIDDIREMVGVVTRSNGKYGSRINPRPGDLAVKRHHPVPDMTQLPFPARDLVNMAGYHAIGRMHNPHTDGRKVLPVMASRGCPEGCSFCSTPQTWTKKVRWRYVDHIIAEIKQGIDRYGIEEVQFEDDTLTAVYKDGRDGPVGLKALLPRLKELGVKACTPNGSHAGYHQEGRLNPVKGGKQLEMYKAMVDAGFVQITIACESGDQRVQDELVGKGLRVEPIGVAIENLREAASYAHTFWTVGYPAMPTGGRDGGYLRGESGDEIARTVEAAMNCGADSASLAIVTPNPGTRVYRQVVEHELLWGGASLDDTLFLNSLTRVDGFSGPEEFEGYVRSSHTQVRDYLRSQRQVRLAEGPGAREDLYVTAEQHHT